MCTGTHGAGIRIITTGTRVVNWIIGHVPQYKHLFSPDREDCREQELRVSQGEDSDGLDGLDNLQRGGPGHHPGEALRMSGIS